MKRWSFKTFSNSPAHVGVKNGLSLMWGWTASGPAVKSTWTLTLTFKFNFHEWGLGLYRFEDWTKEDLAVEKETGWN